MRTLYFDCFAGASGDMILGALVSAGADAQLLKDQLALLGVDGFSVDFSTVSKSGLSANYARVNTAPEHKHRHLSDIQDIIEKSQLSNSVKQRSIAIFTKLAEAEARVHNEPIDHVHFHEVGALDAIVDVVGASICIDLLKVERCICSPIHVGSGMVEMAHGRFPVPPPAVTELLKGVPFYSTEIKGELLTPTGAAIITTLCEEYGPIPQLKIEQTGYGAGTREYENFPNVLRVLIGESELSSSDEKLWMVETSVDDVSPQILGHVMERAFDVGARDCYFTSIQMKKNRPGVLLSILCDAEKKDAMMDLIFQETTTLGIRTYQVTRRALQREIIAVETPYGKIDVKVAKLNGRVVNAMPEFEQCRDAALKAGVPLKEVESAAQISFKARS
jgi:uncharacterized protein (TIGR00299 family) protein